MKVYLSGPITGLTYAQGQGWREYAKEYLGLHGIDAYSPLRGKQYLADRGELTGSYEEHPLSSRSGIVTRDRWDTMRADIMLMNVLGAKAPSLGTVMEMGWADAARVPIVLVMEATGNVHDHPMVRGVCGYHITSLEDACRLIVSIVQK